MKDTLKDAILQRAPDGRISCREARQVADDLGVEYQEVGLACDELKIKIHGCELGCFR